MEERDRNQLFHSMRSIIDSNTEKLKKNLDTEIDRLLENTERKNDSTRDTDKKVKKQTRYVSKKEFVVRESLLTTLFEYQDIWTIYNVFLAILVMLVFHTIAQDILDEGRPNFSFELVTWCFGKFHWTIFIWTCMSASIYGMYAGFKLWAESARIPGTLEKGFIISVYTLYQFAFLIIPYQFLRDLDLNMASAITISVEQTRLIMKIHAFFRENFPRAVLWKLKTNHKMDDFQEVDKDQDADDTYALVPCPDVGRLSYFLFAPTFIYRDEYPRTPGPVNWEKVGKYFLQVIGTIFYAQYIFVRFSIPVFQNFNEDYINLRTVVLTSFSSMMPGAVILILLFWGLLHCWLNAFAEMLRFGDRQFYTDWWNAKSYAEYHRAWNVTAHEWLFTYVYADITNYLGKKHRGLATFAVFILSSIAHEYWNLCGYHCLYPVLIVQFTTFGVAFFFITRRIKYCQFNNIFLLFTLMFGNGIMVALYSMEWYARVNCEPTYKDNYLMDLLTPRSWFCDTGSPRLSQ